MIGDLSFEIKNSGRNNICYIRIEDNVKTILEKKKNQNLLFPQPIIKKNTAPVGLGVASKVQPEEKIRYNSAWPESFKKKEDLNDLNNKDKNNRNILKNSPSLFSTGENDHKQRKNDNWTKSQLNQEIEKFLENERKNVKKNNEENKKISYILMNSKEDIKSSVPLEYNLPENSLMNNVKDSSLNAIKPKLQSEVYDNLREQEKKQKRTFFLNDSSVFIKGFNSPIVSHVNKKNENNRNLKKMEII